MSPKLGNIALPLVTAGVLILTLPGCESNGVTRISSVGPQGLQGQAGPQGIQGPAGPAGADGSNGVSGLDGTNAVATGGLVGAGGVAGTGLLANTGDPGNQTPVTSGVLVAAGGTASGLAGRGTPLAQQVDGRTPGGLTITGRVVQTLDNGGQALVRTGNGEEYLVDGLAAAPGTLVTVDSRENRIVGASGDQPLLAGTALSPTAAQQGDALTVGAVNDDQPATVSSPQTGPIGTGTQPGNGTVQGVVQQVTGQLPALTPRGN